MPRESGELAILTPLWRRTKHIGRLYASARAATPGALVMFLVSSDDDPVVNEAMQTRTAALTYGHDPAPDVVTANLNGGLVGDYAQKINAGARATDRPLLFTGADDLAFRPGWFEEAVACLECMPGVGVVGTNDLGNQRVMRGRHSTHSLVTREYVEVFGTADEPGKVLHEGYWHEYVDDEFVRTAQYRGAMAFCRGSLVEHLHPHWGKGEMDDLYARQAERMRQGKLLLLERQHLWGGRAR